jgi:RimJ/RimL family protein N-acetyltransferase
MTGHREVRIRRARLADAPLVFEWRNTPEIRDLGTLQRGVGAEEHARWFEESVASATRRLFIIEEGGAPVGQLRFDDRGGGRWDVSVYLIPGKTGRGVGVEVLTRGCRELFAEAGARLVVAFIHQNNWRSLRAFAKAGFSLDEPVAGLDIPDRHRIAVFYGEARGTARRRATE